MPVPFPQIPNVVRVVFRGSRDGNERINVFHYRKLSGSPGSADMIALGNHLSDSLGVALSDLICLGTDCIDITLTDLTVANGAQVVVDWDHGPAGGADVFPAQVAMVFSKRTALSGRSNRGRTYVYDISEDAFNGSTLNPAYASKVAAMIAALTENPAVGYEPVVASHTTGDANTIISASVNNVAGVMRSRRPGSGS